MLYWMAFGPRLQRGKVALIGYKLLHYLNVLIPKILKRFSRVESSKFQYSEAQTTNPDMQIFVTYSSNWWKHKQHNDIIR